MYDLFAAFEVMQGKEKWKYLRKAHDNSNNNKNNGNSNEMPSNRFTKRQSFLVVVAVAASLFSAATKGQTDDNNKTETTMHIRKMQHEKCHGKGIVKRRGGGVCGEITLSEQVGLKRLSMLSISFSWK